MRLYKLWNYNILCFLRAAVTTSVVPISETWLPGDSYKWAYQRLFDPSNGALVTVARRMNIQLVDVNTNLYNFFVDGEFDFRDKFKLNLIFFLLPTFKFYVTLRINKIVSFLKA